MYVDDLIGQYGSSPLARGTLGDVRVPHELGRFIPARAGNTAITTVTPAGRAVHPRSRGEHCSSIGTSRYRGGSSPLARGTRASRPPGARCPRFIPARAGNTRPPCPPAPRSPVHPRSRGEHAATALRGRATIGSSPLARGTHALASVHRAAERFIPARAGNTCSWAPCSRPSAVHPRSRGEHATSRRSPCSESGSSPLARGTQSWRPCRTRAQRFIPARAGNTP